MLVMRAIGSPLAATLFLSIGIGAVGFVSAIVMLFAIHYRSKVHIAVVIVCAYCLVYTLVDVGTADSRVPSSQVRLKIVRQQLFLS